MAKTKFLVNRRLISNYYRKYNRFIINSYAFNGLVHAGYSLIKAVRYLL